MKQLLPLVFFLLCLASIAQTRKFPPDTISADSKNSQLYSLSTGGHYAYVDTTVLFTKYKPAMPPMIYLNNIPVIGTPFIDIHLIVDIKVENGIDTGYHRNGKIYITTKKETPLKLLTIDDIVKKYSISSTNAETVWMVDNDFIENLKYFTIDSAFLYKIQVQELPATEILSKNPSGVRIIKIFTRTSDNISKFSTIRLRGLTAER